jgi:ABC-type multidrug transport system fused ATPase/permease subunit
MYDPLSGDVFFDDVNLKALDLKSLRESIGYVSQEPVLIYGSIKENLLYGNSDATDKDIDEALGLANAKFVYTLDEGLNTFVGVGSMLNLSGGQKQRVAIARALIKKPKILVLDEATSALDPKSEAEVQDAISHIQKQKGQSMTIIMIAHRLQTIMTAENLVYLQDQNTALTAAKGTSEYDAIIERLEKTNYAHQQENLAAEDMHLGPDSVLFKMMNEYKHDKS